MNTIGKEKKTENFKEEGINSPELKKDSKEKERNAFIAFA